MMGKSWMPSEADDDDEITDADMAAGFDAYADGFSEGYAYAHNQLCSEISDRCVGLDPLLRDAIIKTLVFVGVVYDESDLSSVMPGDIICDERPFYFWRVKHPRKGGGR